MSRRVQRSTRRRRGVTVPGMVVDCRDARDDRAGLRVLRRDNACDAHHDVVARPSSRQRSPVRRRASRSSIPPSPRRRTRLRRSRSRRPRNEPGRGAPTPGGTQGAGTSLAGTSSASGGSGRSAGLRRRADRVPPRPAGVRADRGVAVLVGPGFGNHQDAGSPQRRPCDRGSAVGNPCSGSHSDHRAAHADHRPAPTRDGDDRCFARIGLQLMPTSMATPTFPSPRPEGGSPPGRCPPGVDQGHGQRCHGARDRVQIPGPSAAPDRHSRSSTTWSQHALGSTPTSPLMRINDRPAGGTRFRRSLYPGP